ncbi:hypothetical protein M011DRAFT_479104 [Sporormia fimetaria CBS 119925]|uniref:Uncharacterized protein n=1 Tax=Sporormia fimetaria CBS 119925 TaxID=1340428 RepID=A0A6A6V7Y5_9PLEO|nr:hypothetical protein M011DRAFT_479104 [Sporormia fimetaria CBS 119925]
MLHLSLPRWFMNPLIERLSMYVYMRSLRDLEIPLLELTVGRFNEYAVGILDPVLCCLVGSFAGRTKEEVEEIVVRYDAKQPSNQEMQTDEQEQGQQEDKDLGLRYTKHTDGTRILVQGMDTREITPPRYPILGHCLRHWSGVREDGVVRGTHLGYPLHIGTSKYYKRDEIIREQEPERTELHHIVGFHELYPGSYDPEKGDLVVDREYDLLRKTKHIREGPGRGEGDGDGCQTPYCLSEENVTMRYFPPPRLPKKKKTDKGKAGPTKEGGNAPETVLEE